MQTCCRLSVTHLTPLGAQEPLLITHHLLWLKQGGPASSELWETHQQSRAKASGIAEAAGTEREWGDGKSWPLAVLYGFQGMDGESVLSSLLVPTHS